jgi:hypothetical protein
MSKNIEIWIARDKDSNALYLYSEKPKRNEMADVFYAQMHSTRLPTEAFPEVTWENSPCKVELSLVKEHQVDFCCNINWEQRKWDLCCKILSNYEGNFNTAAFDTLKLANMFIREYIKEQMIQSQ